MYKIIVLSLFIISCNFQPPIKKSERVYNVKCETPYYNGKAKNASISKHGTYIILFDNTRIKYPPSIKCEIKITRSKGL